MPNYKMIQYRHHKYPNDIPVTMQEVAGHFDVKEIKPEMEYSLHTEYSYDKRGFTNFNLQKYPDIISSHINGVPQLWKNQKWSKSFAGFIIDITSGIRRPKVIEIHPPFNDYCKTLDAFLETYMVFESAIQTEMDTTEIHVENRSGTRYPNGQFLISSLSSLLELCEGIKKNRLSLRIALDIPQYFTAHQITKDNKEDSLILIEKLMPIRDYISGIHLWGKRISKNRKTAHCGNLDSFFDYDKEWKNSFLEKMSVLFDDGKVRNLVLEVNSGNQDLLDIISDLKAAGAKFL